MASATHTGKEKNRVSVYQNIRPEKYSTIRRRLSSPGRSQARIHCGTTRRTGTKEVSAISIGGNSSEFSSEVLNRITSCSRVGDYSLVYSSGWWRFTRSAGEGD